MLNFQFTQNIIANFAPQASKQPAATDIVAALADSFAPKADQQNDRQSNFGSALADASAKTREVRRNRAAENDATDKLNRASANAQQENISKKPDSKVQARDQKDAVSKTDQDQPKPQTNNTDKKNVAANENAEPKKGQIDAKKVIGDVQETIDQIDQALASGGDQLSAEMAALLASMKQVLQQLLQQFNSALQSGAVEGTDTVQLDSKAFAPLLKQLDQIVDQLKKANAALASSLGFGEASLDESADKDQKVLPFQQVKEKGSSFQAHFAAISARISSVSERLQNAIEKAAEPLLAGVASVVAKENPALQNAAELNLNTTELVQNSSKQNNADSKSVPVPLVLQPQNLTAQPVQVPTSQAQAVGASSGQSSSQFGQSGQGQQQASPIQSASPQNVNNQQTLAKDAPSFDHMLKAPVKGSASEQVAFQMKSMVKDGTSKMIVKLDPPELGELEIRMQVSRLGKMDVMIHVERPQTLELLQKDSRFLQQALNDAGLQADSGSMSFNLKGDNPNGGQRQGNNPYPVKTEETFDEDLLQVVSKTYTADVEHGVNIHI